MAKYPRVQFVITCKTCDTKIIFSIYYGRNNIWNNKDAGKMENWVKCATAGHEVEIEFNFHEGWGWESNE